MFLGPCRADDQGNAGLGEPPYATVIDRHAGGAIRVVLGLVTLAVSARIARANGVHVPRAELDLLPLINDLLSWLTPVLLVVMQLGTTGAVGVAAAVALAARRIGVDELTMRTLQGRLAFSPGHAALGAAMAASARVFVGPLFVLDVFGGIALGWTVAAALHTCCGAHRCSAPRHQR